MNRYAEMKNRHSKEIGELPIKFAFSNQQFTEMMNGWGLSPTKDLDKIFRLGSTGGFYKKTDAPQIKEVFKRHDEELEAAIAADSTGKGFIYEMFLNEMENHEYSYTGDLEETLDALGYTAEDIEKDKRLSVGLLMAHKRVMRCC